MKHQVERQAVGGCHSWLAGVRRALLAVILVFATFPLLAADDSDYARWVKPWADRSTTGTAGAELKCLVTTVQGEATTAAVAGMTPLERLNLSYHIKVFTTEVDAKGDCHSSFISNTDSKSASPTHLAADGLQKLDQWLARLPDDNAQLPPPGRRVVVQVMENGAWRIRVYDGAKAPPEVKAILTLLANPFDKAL